MKKFSEILLMIFAVGILVCLFAGGLSVLGYIVAMFMGGETAAALCEFIFTKYLVWVIRITSIFTGVGLLGMYLSKTKALTIGTDGASEETE